MANHSNKSKKKNAAEHHNENTKKKQSQHNSINSNPNISTNGNGNTSAKSGEEEEDISFTWLSLNPEQLLDVLMQNFNRFWQQIRRLASFVMSELGGYQLFESIALWCARNPHLAIFLLAASIVCLLPFLIIFGFGIATMAMAFTGLLMLEGTILTIISVMFVACIGGLAILVPLIGIVTLAAYFGLAKIYTLYGADIERNKNVLMRIIDEPPKSRKTNQQQNVLRIIDNQGTYPVA
ncbi:uncharacterized protein Ldaf1 [Drosophila tropicalis]|uniref:uncharacterized protein Ldaf1 n=1 Tax=Drosophila tropicalis TaxID=46794 RepID=UPI0035AC00EC